MPPNGWTWERLHEARAALIKAEILVKTSPAKVVGSWPETFPNGTLLFEHCSKFGFEGIVSKLNSERKLT